MVKRIFALALAVVMVFSATGCAQEKPDGTVEAVVPTGEISAEQVNAGISTPGDGYYNVFVDITVGFNEDGEISYVYLENPILLAFKVSENWHGGVYLYSGEEMAEMLETLNGIAEAADAETKAQLLEIIEQLGYGGPIEGAST